MSALSRNLRYIVIAIIILVVVQTKWSVISQRAEPEPAPLVADDRAEEPQAIEEPIKSGPPSAPPAPSPPSPPPPKPVDEEIQDTEVRKGSKHDVHLALHKSTQHFKQLPLPDVDLDKLRADQPNHYPPWNDYKNRDYDPNRWHFFPLEQAFYQCSIHDSPDPATSTLVSEPYRPRTVDGDFTPCLGPRGLRLNESEEDWMHAYKKTCKDFPQPLFGSYDAMGLDESVCFTRRSRYAAYGLDAKNDPANVPGLNAQATDHTPWTDVKWGSLQEQCFQENKDALATSPASNRSAILIRTWDSYKYEINDLQAIRSLVSEASLYSHGEYQVILFVQVKDMSIPIWEDAEVYRKTVEASVPVEFRDMTLLWNEKVCQNYYPAVGENSVYWQQWQPVQWFSDIHPEFEYIWNWEMDARYIGHHFHFLDTLSRWAGRQPRKFLWERSSRFFMPAIHQTWHQFFDWVSTVVPPGVSTWGPKPAIDTSSKDFVVPPTIITNDEFKFGVGEPADLISLLPFFDPENTLWAYRDKIWNYLQGRTVPRRVYINTLSRLSKRLIRAMHNENKAGLSMVSEMWPASVALHFGYKAVYAPHPIWTSHVWPLEYANEVFNIGPAAAPDSDLDAPYSPDREHYFGSISFYFWSHLPGTLYRRWLGWNVVDENGEVADWEAKPDEHICLPAMMLHPVKAANFEKRGDYRP